MADGFKGTGQGGKSFQDRELAAQVRRLTLEQAKKVLKRGKGRLYEALLVKLAGSALPRLNEHSGPDGSPIPIMDVVSENHSNKEDSSAQ